MKNKSSVKIPGLSFSWKRALGITQAKQNFSTWWYYGKKKEKLASKVLLGTNNVHMSGTSYYAIPQIDWTNIHINQKALWDQGLYDEAVLAEMGLKMENGVIVKC